MRCVCFPRRREKEDPLLDVDRELQNYAWEVGARKSFWDKRCKDKLYKLKVNWAYLEVSHRLVTFTPRTPGIDQSQSSSKSGKLQGKCLSRDMCLFRTEFTNNTRDKQTFTFKTQRQTTSSCHVTVQKGWRVGADLKLKFAVPTESCAGPDIVPINITGGLSGHYEVKKTEGERFEEVLSWGVDNQVEVEGNHRAVASLMLREESCVADFVIESTIRATHANVPVMQYSRKDGRLVDILEIERHKMADIFREKSGFSLVPDEGSHVIRCVSRGRYEAVYGAEQIIDIKSSPLEATTAVTAVTTSGVKIEEVA